MSLVGVSSVTHSYLPPFRRNGMHFNCCFPNLEDTLLESILFNRRVDLHSGGGVSQTQQMNKLPCSTQTVLSLCPNTYMT